MKDEGMETWWCFKCAKPRSIKCLVGTREVYCPKRHKMKKADTPRELQLLKISEGVAT